MRPVGLVHSRSPPPSCSTCHAEWCFQGVMSAAQVREVLDMGLATERRVVRVVEVAVSCEMAARDEPAAFVAPTELPPQRLRRSVTVDRNDSAGDGICENPIPTRCRTGQAPRGVEVDRRASIEFGRGAFNTEKGEHRHRDLHVGGDRAERAV